jgi:hypothetical protein
LLLSFSFGFGLIADVGHDATVVGISHAGNGSLIVGAFLCTAATAMSEQDRAAHVNTACYTSLTLLGSSFVGNSHAHPLSTLV